MRSLHLTILAFLLIGQFSVVSALPFGDSVSRAVETGEPIFRALLGDVSGIGSYSSSEILFAKLLVTILLISIIYQIMQNIPFVIGKKKNVAFLVSLIIALLSVRYLNEAGFFLFIWLPYGAMGIVLSTLLPLAITFFFIESFETSFFRKVGWTLFGAVFLFLALIRWDDLTVTSNFLGLTNLGWIYVGVALISALLIIFDGNVRAWLIMHSLEKVSNKQNAHRIAELTYEVHDLNKKVSELRGTGASENDIAVRTMEKEIREKKEEIKNLSKGK